MHGHLSVLLERVPELFIERPDGTYVDATYGRGGHARAFLSRLSPKGRLIAFDRDPEAVAHAAGLKDERFTIVHASFSRLACELAGLGVGAIDGLFMDIGVSSPQIDEPGRGFSYAKDGPLDMRMDNSSGTPAADFVNTAPEARIAEVVSAYGEERYAARVARAICERRASKPFERTLDLAECVASAVPVSRKDPAQNRAARTFQALRILVNDELGELAKALEEGLALLKPGGLLAVITFHSLEDRIVKRFFERKAHPERRLAREVALPASALPAPEVSQLLRIFPDEAEKAANPRARSAVLRLARKGAAS